MPHSLLKSQKNSVFEIVQSAGLDPAEFEWTERRSIDSPIPAPALVHRPSNAWFTFDFDALAQHHLGHYSPGTETAEDVMRAGSWAAHLTNVAQWLQNLKREFYAPNLWDELAKQRELTAATEPSDDADNAPFTLEEQEKIASQLREIRELLVRTERLEGERLRAVESRLDYLQEASTRMGRRDWLNIFYGAVFSWALTALVSPDSAREVLIAAAQGLGDLFGGGIPQLPRPYG
jgi:hypothetical protein